MIVPRVPKESKTTLGRGSELVNCSVLQYQMTAGGDIITYLTEGRDLAKMGNRSRKATIRFVGFPSCLLYFLFIYFWMCMSACSAASRGLHNMLYFLAESVLLLAEWHYQ